MPPPCRLRRGTGVGPGSQGDQGETGTAAAAGGGARSRVARRAEAPRWSRMRRMTPARRGLPRARRAGGGRGGRDRGRRQRDPPCFRPRRARPPAEAAHPRHGLRCGPRNAAPMAAHGATVVGTDMEWPMLEAGGRRVASEGVAGRVALVRAPMDRLPLGDASIDLVVAHGIWNLARSAAEFRRAIAEAARVARPDAGLFVFTFSRAPRSPPTTSQSRASRSCSPSSRVNPSAS